MPKLHIAQLRFYILLLLAVFLADTLSANASLHLPASHAPQLAAVAQDAMQHAAAHHHSGHHASADTLANAQQHGHQHGMVSSDMDSHQQHAGKCGNCHDCLSCFSALPLSVSPATAVIPQRHQAGSLQRHYFPPAIAQLQRPPILLPA